MFVITKEDVTVNLATANYIYVVEDRHDEKGEAVSVVIADFAGRAPYTLFSAPLGMDPNAAKKAAQVVYSHIKTALETGNIGLMNLNTINFDFGR